MAKRRVIFIVSMVASSAIFIAGVALLLTRNDAPAQTAEIDVLPELVEQPFAVTLSNPGPQVPLGQPIALETGVAGAEVEALELWDSGMLVARASPGAGTQASFTWPPLAAGPHLLTVRATDVNGEVATSDPIAVDVRAPLADPLPTPLAPIEDGETGAELAARLHIDPTLLATAGELGERIAFDPQSVVPGLPSFGVGPDTVFIALTGAERLPEVILSEAARDGAGLRLEVGAECNIEAFLDGAEQSDAKLAVAKPGGPGFVLLGGAAPDGSQFGSVTLGAGAHLLAVEVDGLLSEPVGLNLPPECEPEALWKQLPVLTLGEPDGLATLVDGILTLPEAYDEFYAYVSVGGKAGRIPSDDRQTLRATSTRVDVSQYLPALDGDVVTLTVYTTVQNSAYVNEVARSEARIPAGSSVADLIGEPAAVTLEVTSGDGAFTKQAYSPERDEQIDFKWTAASPRVTRVAWQVLAEPLATTDRSLDPLVLLATGVSGAQEGPFGSFTIDTLDIPTYSAADLPVPAAGEPEPTTALARSLVQMPAGFAPLSAEPAFATPVDLSGIAPEGEVIDDRTAAGARPAARGRVFVRVIPLADFAVIGDPSPEVFIGLPADRSQSLRLDNATATVDVGAAPNPALAGCARVTVPWPERGKYDFQLSSEEKAANLSAALNGQPRPGYPYSFLEFSMSQFYGTSGIYCPSDFPPAEQEEPCADGDLFCYLVTGAEIVGGLALQYWDLIAQFYNLILDGLAQVISEANVICALVGESNQSECLEYGRSAARAAISAVLVLYGVPPSLPRSEELVAVAEGEIARLGVLLMKSYGVPCDEAATIEEAGPLLRDFAAKNNLPDPTTKEGNLDPCLALMEALVSLVKSQVADQIGQDVAEATGLPFASGIPGFTLVPEPFGQIPPAKVTVSGTLRGPDPVVARSCIVTVTGSKGFPAFNRGQPAVLNGPLVGGPGDTWSATFVLSQRNLFVSSGAFVEGTGTVYDFGPTPCINNGKQFSAGDFYDPPQQRPPR